MSSLIGVDLGGTKIAVARYTSDTWEVQEEKKMDTHAEQKFEHVLKDMISIVEELKDEKFAENNFGIDGSST